MAPNSPAVLGPVESSVRPLVTSVRFMAAAKPKPREGDRRVTKKHGLQIRIHVRAHDHAGRVIGMLVRSGRPVFEWCAPRELPKWQHHLLKPEDLAQANGVAR